MALLRGAVVALLVTSAGLVAGAVPAHAQGVDGMIVDEGAPTSTRLHAPFVRENGLAGQVRPGDHSVWFPFANVPWPWPDLYEPELGTDVLVEVRPLDGDTGLRATSEGVTGWRDDEVFLNLPILLDAMGGDWARPPAGFRLVVSTPADAVDAVEIVADVLLEPNANGQGWLFDVRTNPEAALVGDYDTTAVRGAAGTTIVVSGAALGLGGSLFSGGPGGQVTATWTGGGRTLPVPVTRTGGDGHVAVTLPAGVHGSGVLELRDRVQAEAAHVVRVPVLPPLADPVEGYVTAVYEDLFARQPDPVGLAEWGRALRSGTPYGAVADGITYSTEFRAQLVTAAYDAYLGRSPDPVGLQSWLVAMDQGLHIEQLEAGFLASQEYFANAGGSNEAWVRALYEDVLGRTAGTSEVSSWASATVRAGRLPVARGLLYSSEHLTAVVDGYYRALLHRSIDPAGAAGWVRAIQGGHRDEEIVAGIVASGEYRANVPRP